MPNQPAKPASDARRQAPLTGDCALYAVCTELARHGWRVVPTRSNARHVDIIGFAHENPAQTITVQVKGATRVRMCTGRFWTGLTDLPAAENLYVVLVIVDKPMEFYVVPSEAVAAVRGVKHGDVPLAKVAEYRNWLTEQH